MSGSLASAVEEHKKNQTKIHETWKNAEIQAKEKVFADYDAKRQELNDTLKKLKDASQKLMSDTRRTDNQLYSDLVRLKREIVPPIVPPIMPSGHDTMTIGLRQNGLEERINQVRMQKLENIWHDTSKEFQEFITKLKQRIVHIDNFISEQARIEKESMKSLFYQPTAQCYSPWSVLSYETAQFKEKERQLIQELIKHGNTMASKREKIQDEIDNIFKQLIHISEKEKTIIDQVEERAKKNEQTERQKEMQEFVYKIQKLRITN